MTRARRILVGTVLALVLTSIGVSLYLDSPRATAKLIEPQCALTVAGWLGEKPRVARAPWASAGESAAPVVSEEFDRGYYQLLAGQGGLAAGEPVLLAALETYTRERMPPPYPVVCRKIALFVAKACRRLQGDKRALGECFTDHLPLFQFGLGRFHRGYLDEPELRSKVEEAQRLMGL